MKKMIMLSLIFVFMTGCSRGDVMKTMQEDIQKNGIESAHVQKIIGPTITERDVLDKDLPSLQEALSEFEVEKISKRNMEVLYGGAVDLKFKVKNGASYEISNIGNVYFIVNNENYIVKDDSFEAFDNWMESVFN